ncbi:hypothetical protein CVU37_02450 [candidate division BRC1 bacterium HGW-BRC1-1]|jgi:hypothetical protein|nr:MAG: hypothetical protein CVU37_02450 [candidate division BRC1 bacterium HGW-BRC1-1]
MNIHDLITWRQANAAAVSKFIHQHRELGGIHYMEGDGAGAYIEFCLKDDDDTEDLEEEIREAFPGIAYKLVVVEMDGPWTEPIEPG